MSDEPVTQPIAPDTEPLDYIYGAPAIAEFLKIKPRRVYYFRERHRLGKSAPPIEYRDAFGLCASRKALSEYLQGKR